MAPPPFPCSLPRSPRCWPFPPWRSGLTPPSSPRTERVTAVVETIDQVFGNGDMVSFTGPTGAKRTVAVRSPEMQAFARRLRPGEQVDVTFLDVVGVTVEPAR